MPQQNRTGESMNRALRDMVLAMQKHTDIFSFKMFRADVIITASFYKFELQPELGLRSELALKFDMA